MSNLQDKLEKVPDPRLHQIISFAKSGVRIISCYHSSGRIWSS
jgi:hypothetical protein